MTKNEYLDQLKSELKKNNVPDMKDILAEYEQHFAFKLADGYSEEEIAAKLGKPQTIATQFDSNTAKKNSSDGKALLKIGLIFAAFVEALFYILFLAWDIVLAIATVAIATIGVCMIGNFNIEGLIPYMPYLGSLIFGISMLGLAALFACAAYYCYEFLKQMIRASVRWHKNMTSESGLPYLPWSPQFMPKAKRKLRTVMLWAIIVFGVFFVLAFTVLMLQAGTMGFWHHWNWFVG